MVTRVREYFATTSETEQPSEPVARTTALYHCEPCDATYVSEELHCCPRCDRAVECVPTEHDIGLI